MHDVFISYSRRDYVNDRGEVIPGNPVSKIMDAFDKACIGYWIDKKGIFSGDDFKDVLTRAIEDASVFLFISSEASNTSKWTAKEINVAVYENKKIIPVLIDSAKYNSSVKFDLIGLDYIDMTVNVDQAISKLLESVRKLLPCIDVIQIRREIEDACKTAAKLYKDHALLVESIAEKSAMIGECECLCPVCGSMMSVDSRFCAKCGWLQLPYAECLDGEFRISYDSHLEAFRNIWKKLSEGNKDSLCSSSYDSLSPVIHRMIDNMVEVRGGSMKIGSTSEVDPDAFYDESPAHVVVLSSFCIGKYAVTQEEWVAVMGNNPSHFKGDRLPVDSVNWFDCNEFISRLNELTHMDFRMPTESEWEYAARGGVRSKGYRYSGSNILDSVAWFEDNSDGMTHEVGQKSANELGLYDMTGNVWEWCQDWKADYSEDTINDPQGPDHGDEKVLRGGGWNRNPRGCRISYRGDDKPDLRYCSVGLRLVCRMKERK